MSSPPENEKHQALQRENSPDDDLNEKEVTQVKIIKGNETFNEALIKEPPATFSRRSITLYLACLVGFCAATSNGFDGSLFNSLLENDNFKSYFHVENVGIFTGIVSSMYQIGGVVAIPFVGPCLDTWGRKVGMIIGAVLIVLGTIIQGTTSHTHSIHQFMGGRFLLGFGVAIVSAAGPVYVVEVAHPVHRGVLTAYFNTFWFVGSIVASGASRGALNIGGNSSWLTPVWLQLMFSGIILLFVFWLPESPRWLYCKGKYEKAKEMLIEYHGNGNPESAWVSLQLREYEDYLELNGTDKKWWDYRALFNTRAARYRMMVNIVVSLFGQWAGNSILSYFQSGVLDTAGITNQTTQMNINLGYNCVQFVFALAGASVVDKVGRRPLLLFANIGCSLVWIGMTATTSQFANEGGNPNAARAALAMIYLFGIVFSIGFTPLQALYPVEVLSFEMRAKGMGFSNFAVQAGSMINQFALPVALQKIGWRTYIIFVIWCAIQATVIYFIVPETRNRTLEELDDIFQAKNPRKASTQKKKIELDIDANVVNVEKI